MKNEKEAGDIQIGFEEINALHTGPGTLYHSLGHFIRNKIQSGEWEIGQKIYSERELMQAFNVSRSTVRQGIDYLVKEGILYRIQGKGTFVAPPKIEQGVLRILDFADLVNENGLKLHSKILAKDLVNPSVLIMKKLGMVKDEKAIFLQRLLQINRTPIMIETSYFSSTRFPRFLDFYDNQEEPHRFLDKNFGVKISKAQEIFEPVILEEDEANILETQSGFPALWIETNAFEKNGIQVGYFTALMRGDRCRTYINWVLD